MKQFNELPVKIQKRMLDCQVEQGNKADSGVFMRKINANRYDGGFDWVETKEWADAWISAILDDDYALLYKANPDLIP